MPLLGRLRLIKHINLSAIGLPCVHYKILVFLVYMSCMTKNRVLFHPLRLVFDTLILFAD